MSPAQIDLFNCLLKWFSDQRLFPDSHKLLDAKDKTMTESEEWEVQDLRKIVYPLTYALLDS